MTSEKDDLKLINRLLEIYDQKYLGEYLNQVSSGQWCRETINRWVKGKASPRLSHREFEALQELFPKPILKNTNYAFDFIDLFAGIGGIRRGFELAGGRCVFTSEWNKYALKTYKANHYSDPDKHTFNEDIRSVTLSDKDDVSEEAVFKSINTLIPNHDVLLAGFPCQPFSIAGVSKKNSLGKAHGFECKTQGTLFFDVAKIIEIKRPVAFLLENVKNLKSHDKGKTFKVIMETLNELGYWVSDVESSSQIDFKVIDAQHFVPQHRERIALVGFRKDLDVHDNFSLKDISKFYSKVKPKLGDILDMDFDEKYILTPRLWEYLFNYSIKHKAKGNGFGYGLVGEQDVTRTLSARYYKDGSEILVRQSRRRPRRLTPRECARLMGFDIPGERHWEIPVSDMQAYKQFGNAVVPQVVEAVARAMKPAVLSASGANDARPVRGEQLVLPAIAA